MKLVDRKFQNRRDFTGIYECEHCENVEERSSYDDSNFHKNVIPNMECEECGKKSPTDYVPQGTKYPDHLTL